MTMLDRGHAGGLATAGPVRRIRDSAVVVCVYAGLYLALDWISFVDELPAVGFTLWNPPPACSLALLLAKGLRYAPMVLLVTLASDGLVAGFPAGLIPTVVADAIIAAGYTGVAVALQRFAHADQGFRSVSDITCFLVALILGVPMIAGLATGTFVLMQALPPAQFASAAGHFWIGDLTGIAGLLPALINGNAARKRWNELKPTHRWFDIAVFATGLALALSIVFGVANEQELHFFYLLLLPVIWIAVRHGLPWSAMAVLVTQAALISTVIALHYPSADFLAFQLLSMTVSATGLLVGAVVTERQHAESSLRRQQAELDRMARLTTAGALGMAVAHEISQPLATIATYTHACRQMLRQDFTDREVLLETMAKAEAEVLRAGVIVDRLRDFLSNRDRRLGRVDLGAVAQEIVAALADDARGRGVDIQVDAPAAVLVTVDRLQIEQVLVNLVRNAIEATSGHGRREGHVRVRVRDAGDAVEVAVEDDGPGVPVDMAKHLFEAFQTSKHRGMGLGLWLSREFIGGHGGRLWWDSNTVAGARFVFSLPYNPGELLPGATGD
jgi:two-component system sensor kinase FixL